MGISEAADLAQAEVFALYEAVGWAACPAQAGASVATQVWQTTSCWRQERSRQLSMFFVGSPQSMQWPITVVWSLKSTDIRWSKT